MSEPRLKILHLARGYWPMLGGGERLATEVSEGLARRGHAVRVLLVEGGEGAPQALRPPGFPACAGRDGVELVHESGWSRWERRVQALRKPWIPGRGELRRLVRAWELRAFRRLVARHVVGMDVTLVSSSDLLSLSVPAALGDPPACALLIATQSHLEEPHWPHARIQQCWPRADALAVNTQHEAQQLVARYGIDPAACVVTGCGTPLPPAPAPWPRAPQVLYLGRVAVEKRIDVLLAAMRRVWARRPEARLIVAGGRSGSTPAVDGWVEALPPALRAQVDGPRDLDEPAKARLLAQARCLVLPNRHESFGIVLAEAWGHGTPVIALDTAVGRGVVRHGHDGLLADPADPDALAQSILALVDDQDYAQALGAAGRAQVQQRYTWEHVAERYERAARLAVARHAAVAAGRPFSAGARA